MAFSRIRSVPPLPAIHRQTTFKRYEPQFVVGFGNTNASDNSPVVGIVNTGIRDICLHFVDDVDPSVLSRKPVFKATQYKGCSQESDRANIHRSRAVGPVHAPLDCDLSGGVFLLRLGYR